MIAKLAQEDVETLDSLLNNSNRARVSVVRVCSLRALSGDGLKLVNRMITENCALLGYYAASRGNFLPKFRYNLSVPSSGLTDRLCRNVGKKLPLLAA